MVDKSRADGSAAILWIIASLRNDSQNQLPRTN